MDDYTKKAVQRLLQSFSEEMDKLWMREFKKGAWSEDYKHWRQYGRIEQAYQHWKRDRIAMLQKLEAETLKERALAKAEEPRRKTKKRADPDQAALFG